VQYTNPAAYPPLEHSAHLLADAGMEVRLLGTSILGETLEFKRHPRISIDLRPFRSGGWRQKLHYLSFLGWTAWQAARWQPEWVYASDPLSCPIALVIKALTGARIIYHEHDSPEAPGGAHRPSLFQRGVLAARTALAHRAVVCILPNEERARAFRRATKRATTATIWNFPLRVEVGASRSVVQADRLRLVYHGSIVPSRLPVTVIDALAQVPDGVSLQIAGSETAGHVGYVQGLLDRSRALGISGRVAYIGSVPRRADLMRRCGTCDVGLALLPAASPDLNERTMAGASNKPFDYLANGLPVLVADLPEWRHTFVDAGLGLACDAASAGSIADALRWFLDHPAERAAMGERGRQKILHDWNYETQFASVLRQVLSGAQPPSPLPAMRRADI
jgi:glycosyltransferase involved in cell wall biosynthesis